MTARCAQSGASRCFTRSLRQASGPIAVALLLASVGAAAWVGLIWAVEGVADGDQFHTVRSLTKVDPTCGIAPPKRVAAAPNEQAQRAERDPAPVVDRRDYALRLTGPDGTPIASVEWSSLRTSSGPTNTDMGVPPVTARNGFKTIALALLPVLPAWALLRRGKQRVNSRRSES
jgi:hypothetical protein